MRTRLKLRILAVATLLILVYIWGRLIQSQYYQPGLGAEKPNYVVEINNEIQKKTLENKYNYDGNLVPVGENNENEQIKRESKATLNIDKENKPKIKTEGEKAIDKVTDAVKDKLPIKSKEEMNKNEVKVKGKGQWKDGYWASETEDETIFSINVTEVEKVMDMRRKEVEKGCQEVESQEERNQPPNSKEFLINEVYGLVWCNIFKAASSTWLYNYLKMAGLSQNDLSKMRNSPVEAARQLYPRPSVDTLLGYMSDPNYKSFLVVREPFERLLSAYRDKIESTKQDYYSKLRCDISNIDHIMQAQKAEKQTRTARKKRAIEDMQKPEMNKSESHIKGAQTQIKIGDGNRKMGIDRKLLNIANPAERNNITEHSKTDTRYIVRHKMRRLTSDGIGSRKNLHSNLEGQNRIAKLREDKILKSNKQVRGKLCQPSFRQFVQYILNEELLGRSHNEHWAPYYKFCSPCQVKFDYTFHFETLSRDEAFLMAKIPELKGIIGRRLHSSHTNYTAEEAQYFSQLSKQLLLDLYLMYRSDFKIFGYTVDKYFDYTASKS